MATVTVLPTAANVESDEWHMETRSDELAANVTRLAEPRRRAPGTVGTGVDVVEEPPVRRPTRSRHPVVVRRRAAVGPGLRRVACDRSYEPDLHGGRLTTRGKIVVAALWVAMIAAIGAMVFNPAPVPAPADTATVEVTSGDTLWDIADGLVPGADRRETIAQIMELNGLRAAGDIHPGDVLIVPIGG